MTMPDFIIIGAMKCGTSTLHIQLAAQQGVFMTTPKEPNFFSDDDVFERGVNWYEALFENSEPDAVKGEASTHYTKRLTHPETAERLFASVPDAKLIYLMRHPIDRLVSHYIHEWTMGAAPRSIDDAAEPGTPFVDYSRYAHQLEPYLDKFGKDRILPMFLERMNIEPDQELARVADFLGLESGVRWCGDLGNHNISRERIRRFPFYDALVESDVSKTLRRSLAPKSVRSWIKGRLQMRDRPELSPEKTSALKDIFNRDLATLGGMLGVALECDNFKNTVRARSYDWATTDKA